MYIVQKLLLMWHGGEVFSTVVLQQEGPVLDSGWGMAYTDFLQAHQFFPGYTGFPPPPNWLRMSAAHCALRMG